MCGGVRRCPVGRREWRDCALSVGGFSFRLRMCGVPQASHDHLWACRAPSAPVPSPTLCIFIAVWVQCPGLPCLLNRSVPCRVSLARARPLPHPHWHPPFPPHPQPFSFACGPILESLGASTHPSRFSEAFSREDVLALARHLALPQGTWSCAGGGSAHPPPHTHTFVACASSPPYPIGMRLAVGSMCAFTPLHCHRKPCVPPPPRYLAL